MLFRIVKKELRKQKTINLMVGLFILLSGLLIASGTTVLVDMTSSMQSLFTKSKPPHFVQMHAGAVNEEEIERFAQEHDYVKDFQLSEILLIDSSDLDYNKPSTSENIMDHYLTTQNPQFDHLLNLENDIIQLQPGEIAVPTYMMQQEQLNIGDKLMIEGKKEMKFTIVDVVRDVQMNPSIIHSKRFVIHEQDYKVLKNTGSMEYLIEFRLKDPSKIGLFSNAYKKAALPAKGPAIDYNQFKVLHAITDGIVVLIVFMVSILFIFIALLCLHYTLHTSITEDEQEIGIMRAIGITAKDITKQYLLKYSLITGCMIILGYICSFWVTNQFTQHLTLYLGEPSKSFYQWLLPFLAIWFVFAVVMLFCIYTLRRINRVSPLMALKSNALRNKTSGRSVIKLNRLIPLQIFLILRDIVIRRKMYITLAAIFSICTFSVVVPIQVYQTIKSPSFIQYLGVEESDIRIDLQHTKGLEEKVGMLKNELANDPAIGDYTIAVTSTYEMKTETDTKENITIETGNFSIFPLKYMKGHAPKRENEMSLSYLNAKELDKNPGDHVILLINGKEKVLTVTGIYQDVTNGGRTAKAVLQPDFDSALWAKVSMNVAKHTSISKTLDDYEEHFPNARVTEIESYLQATFGNTVDQLQKVVQVIYLLVLSITGIITVLFFKLLITRDAHDISILKRVGFSSEILRFNYMLRAVLLMFIAIYLGILIANLLGQKLVGFLFSFMGASMITFQVPSIYIYLLIPASFIFMIALCSWVSTGQIQSIRTNHNQM